jgi:hypothetical protein
MTDDEDVIASLLATFIAEAADIGTQAARTAKSAMVLIFNLNSPSGVMFHNSRLTARVRLGKHFIIE